MSQLYAQVPHNGDQMQTHAYNGKQGIAMKNTQCDTMSLMSREIVMYTDAHTDIHMASQIMQGASLD